MTLERGSGVWEACAVTAVRPRKRWALLALSVLVGLLAACSSPQAFSSQSSTSSPTTNPHSIGGKIYINVEEGSPLTTAQDSRLVTNGCLALAGVPDAVTAAVANEGKSTSLLLVLYKGPWYKAVDMAAVNNRSGYAQIAADAKKLDLVTVASLKARKTSGVSGVVTQLEHDCKVLGRSTGR
jgi:hypothetical protein